MNNTNELTQLFNSAGIWAALIAACIGTYAWRGLGVYFSGKINQDSEIFKWLSAVTYAMVAALTLRIILLPVGLLATVPLPMRILATGLAVLVMLSRLGHRMVPALIAGTMTLVIYGLIVSS